MGYHYYITCDGCIQEVFRKLIIIGKSFGGFQRNVYLCTR